MSRPAGPGTGPCAAVLAALALLCGCADTPDLPPPSPALWEVSDSSGAQGWLFGTVHALPDGHGWRTEAIDSAFDRADVLVVEADLQQADSALYRKLATTPGLGPPSLRVDPADRAILATALKEAGLSETRLADTESWAVALALASAVRHGKSSNGVDRALVARSGGKRLIELEGYAAQLAIFDTLPESEQIDMLLIVAREGANAAAEGERQMLAWRLGDVETLEAALETGLLADPELRDALLVRRNREWAEAVDRILSGGDASPFVAVGAAHVPGDQGLVALLREKGYTVTRVH